MTENRLHQLGQHADSLLLTLPSELLLEIFQFFSIPEQYFTIGRVCESWREILFQNVYKQFTEYLFSIEQGNTVNDRKTFINFLKLKLREYIYGLCVKLLEGIKFKKGVHRFDWEKLDSNRSNWFIDEMKVVEQIFEILSKPIEIPKKEPEKETQNRILNVFSNFANRFFSSNTSSSSENHPEKNEFNSRKSFKCITMGSTNVGKSSFLRGSLEGESILDFKGGVKAGNYSKYHKLWDGALIELSTWDHPGFFVSPMLKRGANVAFVMFDLNQITTFERAEQDIEDVVKHEKVEAILIGNKTDLVPETERISQRRKAQQAAFKSGGSLYLETNCVDVKYSHQTLFYVAIMMHLKGGSIERGIKDF